MGKAIIIKGADFSANAIGRIEPPKPELWNAAQVQNGLLDITSLSANINNTPKYLYIKYPTALGSYKVDTKKIPANANNNILLFAIDSAGRPVGWRYLPIGADGTATFTVSTDMSLPDKVDDSRRSTITGFAFNMGSPTCTEIQQMHLLTFDPDTELDWSLKEVSGE